MLEENSADHILAELDSYDFAILRSLLIQEPNRYNFLTLFDDYLCAVVYDTHPLARRKSISLKELKDETFVFPQKGTGFTPNIQYEFPQANTIMSFVQAKMGITINFTKVYQEYEGEGLTMIPLKDEFHYPISLIYPKRQALTDPQKLFLKFIKNWLAAVS